MESNQPSNKPQSAKEKRKKRQQGFGGHGFKKIYKDKRDKKRQRREDDDAIARGEKPKEADYQLREYTIGSKKFDEYYRLQFQNIIKTDEEFDKFKTTLYEKLPVTFRVNPGLVNFQEVVKMLKDPQFISKNAIKGEEDLNVQEGGNVIEMKQVDHQYSDQLKKVQIDYENLKLDCKSYYPQELVYEMMMPKELLKKHVGLKQIHKIIDTSKDAGLLTRQEIVSMMPPILCDIKGDSSVFDMCAAPGSKTAQIVEIIMNDHMKKSNNQQRPKGFIVANDADHKRAYLLTHQLNRMNSAGIVVTNHQAQDYPDMFLQPQHRLPGSVDHRLQFDRIICDVPCSSDAAIRKIPQKWGTWGPRESQTLHPLQIQITKRGLELLKVGGKLSYSTCSLNPIENESVVAALLKTYGDKIKLLKVGLPGFKFQQGLTDWKFLVLKGKEQLEEIEKDSSKGSFYDEYKKFEDVPEHLLKLGNHSKLIKETMFTSHYDESILSELTKCLRVMPHHQNTSGFFITIIQKVKEFDGAQLAAGIFHETAKSEKKAEIGFKAPSGNEVNSMPVFSVPTANTFGGQTIPTFKPFGNAPSQPEKPLFTAPTTVMFGGKKVEPIEEIPQKLPLQIQTTGGTKAFKFLRADPNDPDVQYLKAYFGLENFPTEQLVSEDEHMKRISFISKELSDYLYMDCFKGQLNLINMGVTAFQRNQSRLGTNSDCIYRISQDGVLNILPYMTKRVVRSKNKGIFDQLITRRYNGWRTICEDGNPQEREKIADLSVGCFIFVLELENGNVEALTMHKFDEALGAVSTMISKEHAQSLQMRFLSAEQREQGKTILQSESKTELAECIKEEKAKWGL